jgi:hypothetical protein
MTTEIIVTPPVLMFAEKALGADGAVYRGVFGDREIELWAV